eukprot:1336979-Pleurochrysis_carterae.AAC.5
MAKYGLHYDQLVHIVHTCRSSPAASTESSKNVLSVTSKFLTATIRAAAAALASALQSMAAALSR